MNMNKFIPFFADFQLFADLNTNTTTQTGEGQEILSTEMKTYYDKNIIRNAEPFLVHDQFAQKRQIPKNSGKKIEFRKLNPFPKALTPLSEGVTPNGRKLDWTKVESTVSQYGDYVTTSDVLNLTALDNNIIEAGRILGEQAGRTLDTVTREVLSSGTNVQYADGTKLARHKLESTDVLTVMAIKKAVNTLKKNNAGTINGGYFAIIHPNTAYDLTNDSAWKSVKEYDPKDLYNGEIGSLYGCRFIESSEAKVFSAEKLSKESAQLSLKAASAGATSVEYKTEVSAQAAGELVNKSVIIDGELYKITDATTTAATITPALTSDIEADCVMYGAGGGIDGCDIYSTIVFGADAYGVTDVEGGGLETIIKALGSAGTADPLNQRSTVGWKALKTAEILTDAFMVRIETASSQK